MLRFSVNSGACIFERRTLKHPIEPNTVQETLVIPLYARKICMDHYPDLFADEACQSLIDSIDYDFEKGGSGCPCLALCRPAFDNMIYAAR